MSNLQQSTEEIWKDIPGYEGSYQVSNTGKVKTIERNVPMPKGNGIRYHPEKLLTNKLCRNGYIAVGLRKKGSPQNFPKVHRLVAQAFLPNPENKPQVNHKDGVKHNNSISNLEWATREENQKHRYTHLGHRCHWLTNKMPLQSVPSAHCSLQDIITNKVLKFKSFKEAGKFLGFTGSAIARAHKRNGLLKKRYRVVEKAKRQKISI